MRCLARAVRPEQLQHLVDPLGALLARHVAGEPQGRGEPQRPAHRELAVQHVVLGHHADAVAQLGVVLVEVLAVVEQLAPGRRPEPGHRLEQRRLAAAARPDDAEQGAVAQREADVVEQDRLAHLDGDVVGDDRRRALVVVLVEVRPVEEELVPADGEAVARRQQRPWAPDDRCGAGRCCWPGRRGGARCRSGGSRRACGRPRSRGRTMSLSGSRPIRIVPVASNRATRRRAPAAATLAEPDDAGVPAWSLVTTGIIMPVPVQPRRPGRSGEAVPAVRPPCRRVSPGAGAAGSPMAPAAGTACRWSAPCRRWTRWSASTGRPGSR